MTSFEEFKKLTKKGNVIPLHETRLADTETPVSVYLKIKDQSPYSFLLESVEGGENIARYSFLGVNPFMKFEVIEKRFSLKTFHDDVVVLPSLVSENDHPLDALKKLFRHIRTVRIPGLPRFTGGAVGYFGYEAAQLVEEIPVVANDELEIPDSLLLFYDVVLVFDNLTHQLSLISNAYVPDPSLPDPELRREYEKAANELLRLKKNLEEAPLRQPPDSRAGGDLQFVSSKSEFSRQVDRAKHYIKEGDIFQVVLSQRVKQKTQVDPFSLYRNLRRINPSPYMYFLKLDGFTIIGASPEMLVRVEQGVVETRPIAGTRRRGKTAEEDLRLQHELISDEKERAEHLMLVDLGRNDLGRICEYGSVRVQEFMTIERYSHVMHIVSGIQGLLRPGCTALDAFTSCFPAGTLTGAPKIRAMELIAEMEPVKRGVYGGAIAYVDFSGNLDSCIAIRTIVAKDEMVYIQAGAGIVYDSQPEREYEETLEKLGANLKAMEMVSSV